jgi:hypothetical protein
VSLIKFHKNVAAAGSEAVLFSLILAAKLLIVDTKSVVVKDSDIDPLKLALEIITSLEEVVVPVTARPVEEKLPFFTSLT